MAAVEAKRQALPSVDLVALQQRFTNLRVIPETNQIRAFMTIIRDSKTKRGDFIFYVHRLSRSFFPIFLSFSFLRIEMHFFAQAWSSKQRSLACPTRRRLSSLQLERNSKVSSWTRLFAP